MIKHMKIDENCSHSIARCPCKEPLKKTPEETDKAAAARLAFSRCEKRWEPNMEPKKLHLFNLFFPDTGWKILKSGFCTARSFSRPKVMPFRTRKKVVMMAPCCRSLGGFRGRHGGAARGFSRPKVMPFRTRKTCALKVLKWLRGVRQWNRGRAPNVVSNPKWCLRNL